MKKKKIVVVLLVLFTIVALVLQFLMHPYSIIEDISITMLSIIPSLISFYLFSAFNRENDYEEANRIYENIRGSVRLSREKLQTGENAKKNIEETSDILELMLANMREIKDYYVLSKIQAKNSFFLAVVMCITGFILMGISISAAFFNADNLVSTIVPAIGAAIVEVVAGTSLIVYKKSLEQLNHYYNSLHNNERFLSIVNIVSTRQTHEWFFLPNFINILF
uniref:TRADD-N-associated membrane domain-containing protein n=1 Tax=Agathobacter sp. TaxID=2021311 RepID=UPI004056B692